MGILTFSKATRISTCHNTPNRNPALSHPELASRWKRKKKMWDFLNLPTGTVCGACFTSPHTPCYYIFGKSILSSFQLFPLFGPIQDKCRGRWSGWDKLHYTMCSRTFLRAFSCNTYTVYTVLFHLLPAPFCMLASPHFTPVVMELHEGNHCHNTSTHA